MLKTIDDCWVEYEQSSQAQAVRQFYQDWKYEGMSDWEQQLPNIAQSQKKGSLRDPFPFAVLIYRAADPAFPA